MMLSNSVRLSLPPLKSSIQNIYEITNIDGKQKDSHFRVSVTFCFIILGIKNADKILLQGRQTLMENIMNTNNAGRKIK